MRLTEHANADFAQVTNRCCCGQIRIIIWWRVPAGGMQLCWAVTCVSSLELNTRPSPLRNLQDCTVLVLAHRHRSPRSCCDADRAACSSRSHSPAGWGRLGPDAALSPPCNPAKALIIIGANDGHAAAAIAIRSIPYLKHCKLSGRASLPSAQCSPSSTGVKFRLPSPQSKHPRQAECMSNACMLQQHLRSIPGTFSYLSNEVWVGLSLCKGEARA